MAWFWKFSAKGQGLFSAVKNQERRSYCMMSIRMDSSVFFYSCSSLPCIQDPDRRTALWVLSAIRCTLLILPCRHRWFTYTWKSVGGLRERRNRKSSTELGCETGWGGLLLYKLAFGSRVRSKSCTFLNICVANVKVLGCLSHNCWLFFCVKKKKKKHITARYSHFSFKYIFYKF